MTTQDVNQLLAIMKANYSYAFKAMSQDEKYMLLCTLTITDKMQNIRISHSWSKTVSTNTILNTTG